MGKRVVIPMALWESVAWKGSSARLNVAKGLPGGDRHQQGTEVKKLSDHNNDH